MKKGPPEPQKAPQEAPRPLSRSLGHPWPFRESIINGKLIQNRPPAPDGDNSRPGKQPR